MPHVQLTLGDDHAVLTLDRPEKRNALSPELLQQALAALETAAENEPRALLVEGNGPVFCAGGDIEAMRARLGDPMATHTALSRLLSPLIARLAAFPSPTIAKVQGSAMGAGLGVALACDVVLAAEDARLGAPYAKLGLTPDAGTSYFLARLLGTRRALDLVLSAATLTGEEAARLGLVTRAVPPGSLDKEAEATLRALAKGPTRAYVRARELILQGEDGTLAEALARENEAQAMMYATDDQGEGVRAFLEKRAARFGGG